MAPPLAHDETNPEEDVADGPRWRGGRRLAIAMVAFLAAGAGAFAGSRSGEGGGPPEPLPRPVGAGPTEPRLPPFDVAGFDPFAFRPARAREFLRRGRRGLAHVLYAKSPGGVEATSARVERYGEAIERAAGRHGVSARTLAALVFLESAGREEVIAGGDPAGAVGLGQILPSTAVDLLGMSVDLERSRRLTRRLERARREALLGRTGRRRARARRRARRLRTERRRVDERFRAEASLDGAARYLALARRRFGRHDLAAVSYHMGIGNLERVIADFVAPRRPARTVRRTVGRHRISYPRLYFDSSPLRNRAAYERLRELGDDSRHYLFKLEAAREILRLHREDREELARRDRLSRAKASAEEVLRPQREYPPFSDADALRDAYRDGDLVLLPRGGRRLGYRLDPNIGRLARRLGQQRVLYRGLRREALACLLYIAKEVRRIAGPGALRVTSGVRDLPYQRVLIGVNSQATTGFSLHTTGYAIDIARDFRSERQERALIHVLERLRALEVIDWVYEPGALHLTVGPRARPLMPLYRALDQGRIR